MIIPEFLVLDIMEMPKGCQIPATLMKREIVAVYTPRIMPF